MEVLVVERRPFVGNAAAGPDAEGVLEKGDVEVEVSLGVEDAPMVARGGHLAQQVVVEDAPLPLHELRPECEVVAHVFLVVEREGTVLLRPCDAGDRVL